MIESCYLRVLALTIVPRFPYPLLVLAVTKIKYVVFGVKSSKVTSCLSAGTKTVNEVPSEVLYATPYCRILPLGFTGSRQVTVMVW